MTRDRPLARLLAALALAAGALAAAAPADAQQVRRQMQAELPRLQTPQPHEIPRFDSLGTRILNRIDPQAVRQGLSQRLSTACALGQFNQAKRGRYFIVVEAPDGPAKRYGFAGSNGLNLRDPKNLRGLNQGYLFDLDGSSDCEVYVTPIQW